MLNYRAFFPDDRGAYPMRIFKLILATLLVLSGTARADAIRQTKGDYYDAFRQLGVDLPTPNVYRTASGAPGRCFR